MALPQIAPGYQLMEPSPLLPQLPVEDQHVPPGRLFGVLFRRKWLILALILLLALPAGFVIIRMAPYYDATAILMIDTRKSAFRDLQATIATPDSDLLAISTQVSIIRSPVLASRVVDRLDLTHAEEFVSKLEAPPPFTQRMLAKVMELIGQPLPPRVVADERVRRELTAQLLLDDVSAANDGKTYIITIRARTGDPKLSADIANAFADVYLDFKQQQKVDAIQRASTVLDTQIAPVAARVTKADQAVEAYRAAHGLIVSRQSTEGQDTTAGPTVADQQLAQINSQLIVAQAELAQRDANLRQVDAALRTGQLDAIPEVVASGLISSLRAQQAELSSKAASLGQTQLGNNPAYKSATAAASSVQRQIGAEISKIAASVRSQAAAAHARVDQLQAELTRLQAQVGTQSQAGVSLRQLESEAHAARAIYQDYLGRFQQTLSQVNLQEAEADLVSRADAPVGKSGPPKALYFAIALMVASAAACLLALVLEQLRPGIRTVDDLEARTGLFGLGFVPQAPRNLRRQLQRKSISIYSESISHVSNLLQFGHKRHRAQTVLITSAVPGEGKTYFAVSLAASLGREGRTALLIDCDMRRPSVARVLGLRRTADEMNQQAIWRQGALPGVDVVTFRPVAKGSHNVVGIDQIQMLLDEARPRYDMIILDAPPVLLFADAPILSLHTDGTIMVVRWRHTPVSAIASATKTLIAYGGRVIGGVVTQVKLKEVASEDSGHAYMHKHYSSEFS